MLAFFKIFETLEAILFVVHVMTSLCGAKIPDDSKPINIYHDADEYAVFRGTSLGDSTEETLPKLHSLEGIQRIERHFYIYAREHIFVVDAECKTCSNQVIPYQQVKKWVSNENDTSLCLRKGQDESNCKNFVKVFQLDIDTNDPTQKEVIACGTNSFSPKCHVYQIVNNGELIQTEERPGKLLCPYKPSESIASLIADGNHYTATNSEFWGQDPIILRSPIFSSLMLLRTSPFQGAMLHDPNFLRFVDGGNTLNKVFVFLTEWAIEDDFREIYTRVGQICKNDEGGNNLLRREFTSFFKARLNCSLPGQPPFYFNEMQDATDVVVVKSSYGLGSKKIVFAVMNTPRNSVPASAVCVFTIDDIDRAMNGPFLEKYQREESENVYWEKREKSPLPHLARCDRNPRHLSHENLNFISKHPLMHDSVPAWNMKDDVTTRSEPIFTRSRSRNFLTTIAVDTNAGLKANYTVLLMGTEDGKVVKLVLLKSGKNIVVEERMVINSNCGNSSRVVKKIVLDKSSGTMMVAFDSCVVRAPLCPLTKSNCEKACIGSRDPYCAWNGESCVTVDRDYIRTNQDETNERKPLTQDVEEGNTKGMPDCPVSGDIAPKGEIIITSVAVGNLSETTTIASLNRSPVATAELQTAEFALSTLLLIAAAAMTVGLAFGILIVTCLPRKRLPNFKHKYDVKRDEVTTSNHYESEKLVSDRRSSNQSAKDRQRIASTSSQHNSNSRNSTHDERKRNRTETESSHGNKSDEEAVFAPSNDATLPTMSPEKDVPDASRRNQLHSTSGSVNGKNPVRNSKHSSGSSNENVEKFHQSPQKQLSPFAPPDSRYEAVHDHSLSRHGPNVTVNGEISDPIFISAQSNHKMVRTAPNRSVSFQNARSPHPMLQLRAYGIGNKGANTVDLSHPIRPINRQLSLQMHDTMPPTFEGIRGNPQGYYSPQIKPPNWQPQFQADPNVTPIKNMDNRKMPVMIHSLDRRRQKAQNFQSPVAEQLDGRHQQMPSSNSRKRYASESEKVAHHLALRAPQCQAIHEEDPMMVYPVARPDLQSMKQNMSLNLQPHGYPENAIPPMVDPAIGRIVLNSQSHSNPGTPSREPNMSEFVHPQAHMFPHPNFQEKLRQDSVESRSSPTKSNPSTPMHESRPTFPVQIERKRNFSGPNYVTHQPSSPVNAAAPVLPHLNPQNAQYSMRNRNHSGGNLPSKLYLVNGISIENPAPVSLKSHYPVTQPSLASPT